VSSRVTSWACPPKTILVGVDFGDASARALAIAGIVAAGFDARIRALYAERFEPPPYFTIDQIARLEDDRQAAHAAAAAHLTQFAREASSHAVDSIVVDAPAVEALLDASAAADLIVLGTHGRRGPGRWWLGSVAERVVQASTVPVLVTRASAAGPVHPFERVALVRDGTAVTTDARTYAQQLAGVEGGLVMDGGHLGQCDPDVMQRASLVVMATPTTRPTALELCQAPVLFVPARL